MFSAALLSKAEPYIGVQLKKPFLIGIRDGNLPLDIFRYWLKVDYPYLINYARINAMAIAKANNFSEMQILTNLLQGTVEEMGLHKSYAAKFNVDIKELENAKMGPVKYSYSRHELSSAYSGDLGALLSALLPCAWNYGAVVRKLIEGIEIPDSNPYKDWLKVYSSSDFEQLGVEYCNIIDNIAVNSTKSQKETMESNFMISMQYEVMCWDAYYNQENWDTQHGLFLNNLKGEL